MKNQNIASLIFAIIIGIFLTNTYAASATSPVGYWKTIDDVSGKPKSIVKISESSDNQLSGQIIKIYPSPGKDQNEVCSECKGEKHNQRMVGMTIMTGLVYDDKQWSHGQILDPQNGKVYKCSLKLTDSGKRLIVRGYIGMPLFGRSQTWIRVDLM